jgi:hypothetical protein
VSGYRPAVWPHPLPPPESRDAHHRRDLARLVATAREAGLPVTIHDEPDARGQHNFWVRATGTHRPLMRGRYQLVAVYLQGWIDAQTHARLPGESPAGDLPPR